MSKTLSIKAVRAHDVIDDAYRVVAIHPMTGTDGETSKYRLSLQDEDGSPYVTVLDGSRRVCIDRNS